MPEMSLAKPAKGWVISPEQVTETGGFTAESYAKFEAGRHLSTNCPTW